MKWAEEKGISSDEAMEMAGYKKGEYMGAGAYHWRYVGEEISETEKKKAELGTKIRSWREQKADMKKKIEASKPGDKK